MQQKMLHEYFEGMPMPLKMKFIPCLMDFSISFIFLLYLLFHMESPRYKRRALCQIQC